MPQEGGGQLVRRDAAAVVGDPDQGHAAVLQFYHHRRRAGVDGVFDQFLYHAGGAFDHLAGRDQIRNVGGELPDRGHRGAPFLSVWFVEIITSLGKVCKQGLFFHGNQF